MPWIRLTPARVAGIYTIFGIGWIFTSDRLVAIVFPQQTLLLQNLKGIAFVLGSALLIFGLTYQSRAPLERSNRALERASERGQVLHRVLRHNVRNDLNVIEGHAELIATNTASPQHQEWAEQIEAAAERLLLVSEQAKQLISTTRTLSPTCELVELTSRIEDCVEPLRDDFPAATIVVDLPSGLTVQAVPEIGLAFENVIENAIVHNDAQNPAVEVHLDQAEDDEVTIAIRDNGPGIPQIEQRVFETREESALIHSQGLGLWLTHMIVDQSGGELALADRPTSGSVVLIRLPTETRRWEDWALGGWDRQVATTRLHSE